MITDKAELFDALKTTRKIDYELRNGKSVELYELTYAQGMEVSEVNKVDKQRSIALMITMACPLLADGDIDQLIHLSRFEIETMAGKIMEISGLIDTDDAEKKTGRPNGSSDTGSLSPSADQSVN